MNKTLFLTCLQSIESVRQMKWRFWFCACAHAQRGLIDYQYPSYESPVTDQCPSEYWRLPLKANPTANYDGYLGRPTAITRTSSINRIALTDDRKKQYKKLAVCATV